MPVKTPTDDIPLAENLSRTDITPGEVTRLLQAMREADVIYLAQLAQNRWLGVVESTS
jgi:hypothetical protein